MTTVASRAMAFASPSVSRPVAFARAPEACTGCGHTKSALEAKLSIWPVTSLLIPAPSALTVVTAAMPMRMPRTVSAARPLLRGMAPKARRVAVHRMPSLTPMTTPSARRTER